MRTLYYGRDSNPLCLTQMIQISDIFFSSLMKTLEIDQIQRVFTHWSSQDPEKNLYNPYQPRTCYGPAAHHSVCRSWWMYRVSIPDVLDLRLWIGISHPFRNTAHHEPHPNSRLRPTNLCSIRGSNP